MSRVLEIVYEGATAELRTSYFDKQGVAGAPTSLSYRIVNPTTAAEIRPDTELSPGEVVDIVLVAADHALGEGEDEARRRVIVTAGYGVNDTLVDVYDYLVVAAVTGGAPVAVPRPDASTQTTAWIRCLDKHGAPEGGVTIQVRLVRVDEGSDAYDIGVITSTSAADTGLWAQPIPRGTQYLFEARRGSSGLWHRFRGVLAETLLLPSLLGTP